LPLFSKRTGIRGSNDLVWVGRAANHAAKLSSLREDNFATWITADVYDKMNDSSKQGGKPVILRGVIPTDGSPGRSDLSVGDQLRQRAAMGGEKERADLAAFEALITNWIADALVAQLREEAAAHGVDVSTWLARETNKNEL
jgi:hypothetical protein